MNKIEIEVPKEVRYISEWTDFPKEQLSTGHCIVNKTITGCGYTHYTLTNNKPVILCSPRKFLLENKHIQLPNTYLIINESEKGLEIDQEDNSVFEGKETKLKIKLSEEAENLENIRSIKSSLISYLLNCKISNQPPKILVTYDSLKYVIEVLEKELQYYSIIVDEFQNIFMDSRFKADTELNFVSILQDCPNVTYLSATPYIEEYLNELDEFKNLPYYEFKWHPDRLQTIRVDMRKTFRPSQDIDTIISDYLNSRFPEKVNEETGEIHQSREVVFYVNSVKMICNIIKRNGLVSDQVNIICADTPRNKKQLRKAGVILGTAPLKGEPHKMFTFCTRTTYAGADFYSTSAMSVIVSDCKIDSLATDIRMDFPQIMGRQRLKENVFRDECIFIYKLSDEKITVEEYIQLSDKKIKESRKDIKNYEILSKSSEEDAEAQKMLKDIRLRIKVQRYGEDYTGIDEKTGQPKINKLVMLSERRAFELRSNVYKNDVQIYNEFSQISSSLSEEEFYLKASELNNLRTLCRGKGSFETKMKAVCDLLLNPRWYGKIHVSDLYWLTLLQRNYLNYLGPEKIRTIGYREADIKREIYNKTSGDIIKEKLSEIFSIGSRYSLKDIKTKLSLLYFDLGIAKTPKASDLEDYYHVKTCLIYDPITKKQSRGYEILSLK